MDKIPESIQKIIQDYISDLAKKIPIQKAILFGSYARGNNIMIKISHKREVQATKKASTN